MRALRLTGARSLELVDLPDPEPAAGEVVVRVASTGICGSDLTCYKWGIFAGSILGHETAGVVEASNAEGWEPGEAVAIDPKIPCGDCDDCASGAEHRCVEALTLGIGARRDGGFADLVAVPAALLHRLPPGVSAADACLVEPLSVALHGVWRAGETTGQSIAVVGLGPIGLLTIAALREAGAGRIVGIDPVSSRRSLAQSIGADETFEPGPEARAAGSGSAVAFEASGRADILQETTDLVRAGGRVVLLGVPMKEAPVVPLPWITREITIAGAVSSTVAEFGAAIGLLARRPELTRIITRRLDLDAIPGAFEDLISPTTEGKVTFTPSV